MEDNYLYKTRVSLVNLDVFLLAIIAVFAFFVNVWIGLAVFCVLMFWIISMVSMRMYIYEDRIEYRAGYILKTYVKRLPLKNISVISYSSDFVGKIFNYGSIVIGTYNEKDSISLKGMKNAKMLVTNIKALIYRD